MQMQVCSSGRLGRRSAAVMLCLCALSVAPRSFGYTVEHAATRYVDKQYQCDLTVILDAPLDRVEAVLRDYERYPTLDPRILEASILERPDEHVVVLKTRLRACFGPFCRSVSRVERVEESSHGLEAITDAARSDVKFGETHTALEAVGGGTRVVYQTRITPGFWAPPIVGRRWMLKTLASATGDLFMNVEAQARSEHAAPQDPETQ